MKQKSVLPLQKVGRINLQDWIHFMTGIQCYPSPLFIESDIKIFRLEFFILIPRTLTWKIIPNFGSVSILLIRTVEFSSPTRVLQLHTCPSMRFWAEVVLINDSKDMIRKNLFMENALTFEVSGSRAAGEGTTSAACGCQLDRFVSHRVRCLKLRIEHACEHKKPFTKRLKQLYRFSSK